MRTCPICKKPIEARAKNPFFPFCSERCKLVDLGKWLGEAYRVPGKVEEEEDDERPELPDDAGPHHDA